MNKKTFDQKINLKPIAPGILPGVNPNQLKAVICKNCGGNQFIITNVLRHASMLQTATGHPMIVSFNGGYACTNCGEINKLTVIDEKDIPKESDNESEEDTRSIH